MESENIQKYNDQTEEKNMYEKNSTAEKTQMISEESKLDLKKEDPPSNLNVNKTNEILQSGTLLFFVLSLIKFIIAK